MARRKRQFLLLQFVKFGEWSFFLYSVASSTRVYLLNFIAFIVLWPVEIRMALRTWIFTDINRCLTLFCLYKIWKLYQLALFINDVYQFKLAEDAFD